MLRIVEKLEKLCVHKIAELFPIPLSQGEWERKKYRRVLRKLDVTDSILEDILSEIFGSPIERRENEDNVSDITYNNEF